MTLTAVESLGKLRPLGKNRPEAEDLATKKKAGNELVKTQFPRQEGTLKVIYAIYLADKKSEAQTGNPLPHPLCGFEFLRPGVFHSFSFL